MEVLLIHVLFHNQYDSKLRLVFTHYFSKIWYPSFTRFTFNPFFIIIRSSGGFFIRIDLLAEEAEIAFIVRIQTIPANLFIIQFLF